MKTRSLFSLLLLLICCCWQQRAMAQVPTCGADVPFYSVDLTGSPSGSWTSPNHSRVGSCCTSDPLDRCTSFSVLLDTAAVLIQFEIIAGSIPSGAMYYQIGCGDPIPVGSAMWVFGPGPINITFCKPGNNPNVYAIRTFPKADTVISGSRSLTMCGTTTLSIPIAGGTWSSSNTAVAKVDTFSGVVTGITVGTANISYILGGLLINMTTVTVNANVVPPITGTLTVCVGGTTALDDATPGGAWSSSTVARATVGSTGVVSGISTGTSTITYSLGAGCTATAVVTVTQAVPALGTGSVCAGSTITLTDATAGGTWSSGNTSTATIDGATGIATGVAAGTANITYTVAGGCRNTAVLTVNPVPAAIAGAGIVCAGSTATLTDGTSGGTWTSSNVSIATIVSGSGIFSGIAAGTATVAYTIATGCKATKTITVNGTPVISGIATLCLPATISLSASIAGGTWSSSNTSRATINSVTGVVAGVSYGTAVITYLLATGCLDADVISVNTPSAISGASAVCSGKTTSLTDATSGGTWSTSDGSIATINSSGVLSGIASGTVNVTYTTGGCYVTKAITVNGTPVISGIAALCMPSTISLSGSIAGGTWSSSNTSRASINSATGVVTGVSNGTAVITYQLATGCMDADVITVGTPPSAISGASALCSGNTITLTDATSGGTWSTSDGSIATISSSGVLSGIAAGTVNAKYTTGGCYATKAVTVNGTAVISGPTQVCIGSTVSLSSSVAGGTWSSSNGKVSINSATGVATGIGNGTTTISYQLATGCNAAVVMTVNPVPAAIAGAGIVCEGSAATLTDATSGGTWSSSNTGIATIGSGSGIFSGIVAGTATVAYTIATGCKATKTITVNGTPVISGGPVCVTSTVSLSGGIAGGTWSSSNAGVASVDSSSGVATGMTNGTAVITYQLATGCKDTDILTVNALPAAIAGSGIVCTGSTATLTDATSGGTWSSGNGSVATIGSGSGIFSGIAAGTAPMTYTTAAGCRATKQITVNPTPAITGSTMVCFASTTTLNGSVAGGTWSSSNAGVASIGSSSGVATAMAAGTTSITYQLATGCKDVHVLTVNALPASISGSAAICAGSITTLTDVTAAGTWSSGNVSIATIGSLSGVLSGITSGVTSVTYTTDMGCRTIAPVTVNATPVISGAPAQICAGATTSLSSSIAGGTWSSSNTGVASVASSGVATGVAAGTADITYQLATGCKDADVLTINLQPAAISGMASTCVDGTVTLSDATDDGTWYSGNTAVATVGSSSGVVSGIATGTAPITYTTAAGCRATQEVTVMAQPVIGAPQVCEGQTTALSCAISGGSWSSSDVAMVTVDAATGMALGIGAGNPVISYTTSFGCQAAATITVNVTPPAISGAPGVCNGGVTTFSNSLAGGSWACADATVGSIDGATGIFTTVGIGTTTITYATSTGCSAVKPVSVNAVAPLTGNNRLCITYTTTLSSALAGGIWTSGSTDTATVNSLTGVVYGVGPGTAMITYTTAGGCIATSLVKVSNYVYPLETQPLSTPLRTNICLGNTLGLNSPFGGDGHWTTSDITRATVTNLVPGSLAPWGVVSALSLGTVTISYTASNGCVSTHTITINAMPVITSIAPTVCRYGTTTLNATPAAGQWISHNITTAQVTNYWTGVVHASLLGVAEIAYRLFTYDQCGVNILLTVNACTPREDEAGGGNESSVGYAISPNPGAGNFTISQNVAVDGPILVRVVNCLGQAVYNGSVAFVGGSGTLDLLNVAQGIYLVELEGKPGEKKVIRVAVQK